MRIRVELVGTADGRLTISRSSQRGDLRRREYQEIVSYFSSSVSPSRESTAASCNDGAQRLSRCRSRCRTCSNASYGRCRARCSHTYVLVRIATTTGTWRTKRYETKRRHEEKSARANLIIGK